MIQIQPLPIRISPTLMPNHRKPLIDLHAAHLSFPQQQIEDISFCCLPELVNIVVQLLQEESNPCQSCITRGCCRGALQSNVIR